MILHVKCTTELDNWQILMQIRVSFSNSCSMLTKMVQNCKFGSENFKKLGIKFSKTEKIFPETETKKLKIYETFTCLIHMGLCSVMTKASNSCPEGQRFDSRSWQRCPSNVKVVPYHITPLMQTG